MQQEPELSTVAFESHRLPTDDSGLETIAVFDAVHDAEARGIRNAGVARLVHARRRLKSAEDEDLTSAVHEVASPIAPDNREERDGHGDDLLLTDLLDDDEGADDTCTHELSSPLGENTTSQHHPSGNREDEDEVTRAVDPE